MDIKLRNIGKLLLIAIAIGAFLLYGTRLLALYVFSSWECGQQEFGHVVSSDKLKDAYVVLIDCGATTDFSTVVRLKNDQSEDVVFATTGKHIDQVKVEWVNDTKLKIIYSGDKSKITNSKDSAAGISVVYE